MTYYEQTREMTRDTEKSNVNRRINENLKRVYDEALNEELPDRFVELLSKLKDAEASGDEK